MVKSAAKAGDSVSVAGFTVSQWKHHMDHDEDWTERLEGADDGRVQEIVAGLDHAEPAVRALACNLAYGLGIGGLGEHASPAVQQLAQLAQADKSKKVRTRAGIVHESLSSELQRATVRRELAWLAAYDPGAHDHALKALRDERDEVRLQTYLWWANASRVPADVGQQAVDALTQQIERESDEVLRRAAQIAQQHLQSEP